MDFAIRESKYCCDGPMAVIRLGSCCSISDVKASEIVINDEGSFGVYSNFDTIRAGKGGEYYFITDTIQPDADLTKSLIENINKGLSNI